MNTGFPEADRKRFLSCHRLPHGKILQIQEQIPGDGVREMQDTHRRVLSLPFAFQMEAGDARFEHKGVHPAPGRDVLGWEAATRLGQENSSARVLHPQHGQRWRRVQHWPRALAVHGVANGERPCCLRRLKPSVAAITCADYRNNQYEGLQLALFKCKSLLVHHYHVLLQQIIQHTWLVGSTMGLFI